VDNKPNHAALAAGLLLAVFIWGANNTATKFIVKYWPPIFTGSLRFVAAALILFGLIRWTKLFAQRRSISPKLERQLWWRGGLNLAVYIVAFNWALRLTSVSHVALYLGAAPVWAVIWEGRPRGDWKSAQRYGAAALALAGVLILFWPTLHQGPTRLLGEGVGLASSILWTSYGRQCRALGAELSGPEISAHTFWRAGLLLAPLALVEVLAGGVALRADVVALQLFCILGGGVTAFAIWNNALRYWKTSKVYLFNNLIPLSTMGWAHVCLGEPITRTFWPAMLLIAAAVLFGQANWQRLFGLRWAPVE
jgi:drug/metabolite transporter (DMT)-like permease